jgi:hypothetical protein
MQTYVSRLLVALAALLAALAILLVALIFLCGALYMALLGVTTPPLAALATGGAALLTAILVLLVARFGGAPTRRVRQVNPPRRPDAPGGDEGLATAFGSLLGEQLVGLARQHAKSTVLGSLVAGLALGASPELRGLLRDLLKR